MKSEIKRIMRNTGALPEDIENTLKIMDYFLEGFRGTRDEAIIHLEKMRNAMYIDISESEWVEWLKKDIKRWRYVDRALKSYSIESRKALINTSYFLFVRDIYSGLLKLLRKAAKAGNKPAKTKLNAFRSKLN